MSPRQLNWLQKTLEDHAGPRWGWRDRMSAAVPLLVPLFLTVLRRRDELAVAMESRCYTPGRSRTSLVPHRTGAAEGLLLGACGLLLILLILS